MQNEQIDPFEFDTQARQELYNLDNGSLPDNSNVTFDPALRDGHDYRHLSHAHQYMELMGCESEPDTKGPFIITSTRRRANELFYEDLRAHNKSSEEGDPSVKPDNWDEETAVERREHEHTEWSDLDLLVEAQLAEYDRDNYWTNLYCNNKYYDEDYEDELNEYYRELYYRFSTHGDGEIGPESDAEVAQEALERQAIAERVGFLEIKNDKHDDRRDKKICKNIDKQLSFADQKQLFYAELERQKPEKIRSKRRRHGKLHREILAKDYNEAWEEARAERLLIADVIQMDIETSDDENAAKERVGMEKAA